MAKLHFYYSAMNAGKSTFLLQSSYNYRERGMHTLLFSPAIDDRYQQGEIHSRIGLKAGAMVFNEQVNIYQQVVEYMDDSTNKNPRCILIDEAQFLTKKHVMQLIEITNKLNIPVLAYGLRSDYMGEPFEGSMYLLALAEELNEIKTICHCGSKATMNLRINSNGQVVTYGSQIHIGGNESYISTCRKHFYANDPGKIS